ncbi:hypothetical protein [Lacinutrix sp. Bg11-31]|uniref:hypothetical protein n=1 Tax=Lacinutrix sp. Bg11-31 TaxID=2057808 RepID=UPI0012FD962C|nr:hypothetical protein [Lacinutrix sp. Bg11-31]
MKIFKIVGWIALICYWVYKIYTNDLQVKTNTMYYVAVLISVLGLAKNVYDYKTTLKDK